MSPRKEVYVVEGEAIPNTLPELLALCDKLGDDANQAVCIPVTVLEELLVQSGGSRFFVLHLVEKGYIVTGGKSGQDEVIAFSKKVRRIVLAKEEGKILRADSSDSFRTDGGVQ